MANVVGWKLVKRKIVGPNYYMSNKSHYCPFVVAVPTTRSLATKKIWLCCWCIFPGLLSYPLNILGSIVHIHVVCFTLSWWIGVGKVKQILNALKHDLYCNRRPPVFVFIENWKTYGSTWVNIGMDWTTENERKRQDSLGLSWAKTKTWIIF